MKPVSFHHCPPLAAALTLAATGHLVAETVNLSTADGFGATSFNAAGGWSNAAAPVAGNDYVVAIERLRTPTDVADYTFAGDSLAVSTATGKLSYKVNGSSTITVPDLILDGGIIDHINAFDQIFTLAGAVTVNGTGSRISATQGPIIVTATVGGSSDLTVLGNLGVTFAAENTFTGDLIVNGAFVLSETGSLLFEIGASGVNNSVTGTAGATFNGMFDIDLSGAGTTVGDTWTLVAADTLADSYGTGFMVVSGSDPWTRVEVTPAWSVWVSPTGDYQFDQTTGILRRVATDSDQDGLPDSWEQANFGIATSSNDGSGDPDGDWCSSYLEYLSDTDPVQAASFPDSDSDTLPDGWEFTFFGNLAEGPDGDYDTDWNSNLVEYTKGTDPTATFDYPDEDNLGSGDGINDGWEIHYFGSIAACNPDADSDGDLFSNIDEFWADTDPTEQTSSPDTDDFFAGDGLPDGWEVKYFRTGNEDLETVIAKWGPNDDPDNDGSPNFAELGAGTDPADAASHPSALAYWRFEERTAGVVPVGDNSGGNQANTVIDSSGWGNHLMTWRDYTSPYYQTVLPSATVPATGESNTASLGFARDGGNLFITDNIYSSPGTALRTYLFDEFTIEASFNASQINNWQVVIGKSGNPVGGQPPFSIKLRNDNYLSVGIVDGSGTAREVIGTRLVEAGAWYSVAATASDSELKLWVKAPGDGAYVLEGSMAIQGAFYNYAGLDAPWVIGLGKWNGADADPFGGSIDEVRITPEVLDNSLFLFHEEGISTPYSEWADTNITDPALRGENDDADGDGTTNIVEFLLGLDPMDGSSFFAAVMDGSELSWPAADGLSFTIQRSTTLQAGSWSNVGTVVSTGGTASWSDPAPPAGAAFYRVDLATE
ncbi:LamG domain-containing protein [Luteolibacter marinus]|uniref:LamG domain-containing protein n=1 Tax=Luteolibacter marinus TaxID=2776705 RepID=UPI001867F409|nr:LamG domain-containing protein [Luteolibacter marinus]